MNIQDVNKLSDGMPITDLAVRVEAVMDRKADVGEYGPWSFQDLKVKDSTGEIWVKAQNHPELKHLKGSEVVISAFKSEQHGWVGATALDDEYNGKVTRKIKLTKTGKIDVKGGNGKAKTDSNSRTEPNSKDASICRQTACKCVAQLYQGSSMTAYDLIAEAEIIAYYMINGESPTVRTEQDAF